MIALLAAACATAPAPRALPPAAPAVPSSAAPVPAAHPPAPTAPAQGPTAPLAAAGTPERALQDYYAAIEAHDYRGAWRMWEDDGKASGQTLKAFGAGFADTAHTRVVVGTPGRIEGAAGSSYVTVPVDVFATTAAGAAQHFSGSYDLRRLSNPEPGPWRLHAASLKVAP